MILSETQIDLVVAGIYGVAFVVLVGWLRQIDRSAWRFCVPVAAVVGVAAFFGTLQAFDIAAFTVGEEVLDLPNVTDDVIAFGVLFVVVGMLADATRKQLAGLGGGMVGARIAFEVLNIGLVEGVAALLTIGLVFGGYFFTVWLFVGPVWQSAQSVSPRQRLVHWKSRNLLLFIFATLLLLGMLLLAGAFNQFEQIVVTHHINLAIRLGMAAFIFVNVHDLVEQTDSATDEKAAVVTPE